MEKDAVRMTEGPIAKQIITFAMPVFFGNLFQQLYNTVDSLIVGNFVGDEALAAVSTSSSFIFLMVGLFYGIFAGAGVVIAQFYGADDKENVKRAIHTTVAIGIISGIIVTVIGVIFSSDILILMHTDAKVLPISTLYFRIYFLGSIFSVMYNAGSGIFQAMGDSKHPLYYLVISAVANIILDLLFVAVFHWGIVGAAVATIIAQGISGGLIVYRLTKWNDEYRVYWKKVKVQKDMAITILKMGIPSGIQNAVIGFANIVVQSNINTFKELAMAGCGSYFKLEGFAFLPVTSFSLALTTFIGQNIGANRLDRAKKGAVFGIVSGVVCAELIGIILYIFSPYMMAWFSQNPKIIEFGVNQARMESLFYCVLSFSHMAAGVFRGAGKAVIPMAVMLLCWCVFRVSFLTIMLSHWHDIRIIYGTYPLTWSMTTVIFGIYLLTGRWMKSNMQRK